MQQFVKKPDTIYGVKFTGGEEQAQEIMEWANSLPGLSVTVEHHPEGGQYNAKNEVDENEQLWIVSWMTLGVSIGEWAVYDPNMRNIIPMTDEAFNDRYRPL